MIETTLGPYRIVSKLGEGGMGEVYRAIDTRLNRQVAIKVLPEAFALDADRLARFTREAQTLASLNHPNIATIYGIEESSGIRALVMELVEGEDLSSILSRGPLTTREALPIVRQVAEALEAAHEQGIVHRDLKPPNIKVRHDGTVKVLDFGLAKAQLRGASGSSPDPLDSPTMTVQATMAGAVIGTASYMSPEQAKGRVVDRRTDIWAFGVLLHEILTGRRLFDGESIAETIGLIVTREPDVSMLPDTTPPAIRELVARCLVKDPKQRLRDMGEARLVIENVLAGRSSPSAVISPVPASAITPLVTHAARRRSWIPWVLGSMGVVAGLALARPWMLSSRTPAPVTRLSISLPPNEQVTTTPAISPDGRTIAYVSGRSGGSSQLYVRSLSEFTPRTVASSRGAQYPFFSADGRTIAFFAGGKLRRASVDGGGAVDLASSPTPWGGTFDSEGRIVFTTGLASGLWRVGIDGGTPTQLTTPDGAAHGYAHVFPQRLEGSRDLLFGFWGRQFYLARLPAEGGDWRAVTPPSSSNINGIGLHAGGFIFTSDGSSGVIASRWDPTATTLVRPDTPVIDHINWGLSTDRSWLSVSDTGTAVYVPGDPRQRTVLWVDRSGKTTPVTTEPTLVHEATLSHDGTRVAFGSMQGQWVVDVRSGARTRLVSDVRAWHGPWLPGDERLFVSSNKDGDWDLYTVSANGGGMEPLLKRPYAQHPQAVAPDGTLVFLERNPTTGSDLWMLSPDRHVSPLVVTPYNETSPSISPEGRYLAYASDESGRSEVYAVTMAGGSRVQVSVDGGSGPIWSRDGRELFYRSGDMLVSVGVSTDKGLSLGTHVTLLDLADYDPGYFHDFDVSADGQRFLVIRTEPAARPARLDVIINWFEELNVKLARAGATR